MVIITYIIKTENNDFYCGKTNNILRRFTEHRKEKYPHWFAKIENRKNFLDVIKIVGDYENNIKRFGVKRFYECFKNLI